MDLTYCLQTLCPDKTWSVGSDYESIRMTDGSAPPSLEEMQACWQQHVTARELVGRVRELLRGVLATFSSGEMIAYAAAIEAVSAALDRSDLAAAQDIVATFPVVDESLRARLLSSFK